MKTLRLCYGEGLNVQTKRFIPNRYFLYVNKKPTRNKRTKLWTNYTTNFSIEHAEQFLQQDCKLRVLKRKGPVKVEFFKTKRNKHTIQVCRLKGEMKTVSASSNLTGKLTSNWYVFYFKSKPSKAETPGLWCNYDAFISPHDWHVYLTHLSCFLEPGEGPVRISMKKVK